MQEEPANGNEIFERLAERAVKRYLIEREGIHTEFSYDPKMEKDMMDYCKAQNIVSGKIFALCLYDGHIANIVDLYHKKNGAQLLYNKGVSDFQFGRFNSAFMHFTLSFLKQENDVVQHMLDVTTARLSHTDRMAIEQITAHIVQFL